MILNTGVKKKKKKKQVQRKLSFFTNTNRSRKRSSSSSKKAKKKRKSSSRKNKNIKKSTKKKSSSSSSSSSSKKLKFKKSSNLDNFVKIRSSSASSVSPSSNNSYRRRYANPNNFENISNIHLYGTNVETLASNFRQGYQDQNTYPNNYGYNVLLCNEAMKFGAGRGSVIRKNVQGYFYRKYFDRFNCRVVNDDDDDRGRRFDRSKFVLNLDYCKVNNRILASNSDNVVRIFGNNESIKSKFNLEKSISKVGFFREDEFVAIYGSKRACEIFNLEKVEPMYKYSISQFGSDFRIIDDNVILISTADSLFTLDRRVKNKENNNSNDVTDEDGDVEMKIKKESKKKSGSRQGRNRKKFHGLGFSSSSRKSSRRNKVKLKKAGNDRKIRKLLSYNNGSIRCCVKISDFLVGCGRTNGMVALYDLRVKKEVKKFDVMKMMGSMVEDIGSTIKGVYYEKDTGSKNINAVREIKKVYMRRSPVVSLEIQPNGVEYVGFKLMNGIAGSFSIMSGKISKLYRHQRNSCFKSCLHFPPVSCFFKGFNSFYCYPSYDRLKILDFSNPEVPEIFFSNKTFERNVKKPVEYMVLRSYFQKENSMKVKCEGEISCCYSFNESLLVGINGNRINFFDFHSLPPN